MEALSEKRYYTVHLNSPLCGVGSHSDDDRRCYYYQ
jgi:hypothetical protein